MNHFEPMESRRLMSGSITVQTGSTPDAYGDIRLATLTTSAGLSATDGSVQYDVNGRRLYAHTNPLATLSGQIGQLFHPGGWTIDYTGLPEGPPKALNLEKSIEFSLPTIGANNRFNVYGTTNGDNISVEQVTGVDQSGELPMILYQRDENGEWHHHFNGSPSEYPWSWEIKIDQVQQQLDTFRADYQFVLDNPTVEHAAEDAAYYVDAIPRLEAELTRWQGMMAALNGPLTRVRVAGLYDAYMAAGSTPITVAVDSGAGNDQISIAPNVAAKTSVLGGKGNDVLISGKQKTYLAGGAGDDRLVSRSQKGGTLDGGAGVNVYESRFSKVAIYDARSADAVTVRGTTLPMSTAVGAMNVAPDRMSDLFLTPDGLTI